MLPTKLHAMQSLVRTIFNKEDEDIRKYDKNRYLALLNSEKFHRIFLDRSLFYEHINYAK